MSEKIQRQKSLHKKLNVKILTNVWSFYRIGEEIDWLMTKSLWKHDIISIFHDQEKDVMVFTSI